MKNLDTEVGLISLVVDESPSPVAGSMQAKDADDNQRRARPRGGHPSNSSKAGQELDLIHEHNPIM